MQNIEIFRASLAYFNLNLAPIYFFLFNGGTRHCIRNTAVATPCVSIPLTDYPTVRVSLLQEKYFLVDKANTHFQNYYIIHLIISDLYHLQIPQMNLILC